MDIYDEQYRFWKKILTLVIVCGIIFIPVWIFVEKIQYKFPLVFDSMLNFSTILAWWIIPLMFVVLLFFIFHTQIYKAQFCVLLGTTIFFEIGYYYISHYCHSPMEYENLKLYYVIILILNILFSNQYVLKYKNIIKNSNSSKSKFTDDLLMRIFYPDCRPRQYKIYGGLLLFYFVIFTYCSVWWAFYFLFTGKNIFYDFFVLFFIWSATDLTLSFIS